MKVTFLEADVFLTKSYTPTSKTSYPSALNFTSHTKEINNIEALYLALVEHAQKGHCLLKGAIQRPLACESRAGSTSSMTPTKLGVLDLDGLPKATNVDHLLTSLGFDDVDYIIQYSASMGVIGQPDLLKAHVYLLLRDETSPATLKNWVVQSNLTNETLKPSLKLTKTGMGLSYPLDPTVAQNDKLVYIAKPICNPPTLDTLQQRIFLHKRNNREAVIPATLLLTPDSLRSMVENKVNELRMAAGMEPKKKWSYKTHTSGVQYLTRPDQSIVTEVKHERGFVYLNLNGGDSFAYYHPEDRPEFLYNFKDEPIYKLNELAPAYYAQAKKFADDLKKQANLATTPTQVPSGQSPLYLVFRDMKSAIYYNGIYYPADKKWNLAQAKSEKQLSDFMVQYGQPEPEVIPIWDLVFDPAKPPLDIQARMVNVYSESPVLEQAKVATYKSHPKSFPTIQRVIMSVTGDDVPTYEHFINWLAYVVQYKTMTQTGWVMQGVHGTGKGTLIHHILRPIIGLNNSVYLEQHQLEDKFNEYFENSLLTCVDEVEISSLDGTSKIMAKFKSMITEPFINIRKMRSAAYQVKNYNNFIIFSNFKGSIVVEPTDRRYNIGLYQTTKLRLDEQDIFQTIPAEIDAFATYLCQFKVDVANAHSVIENEARAQIKDLSLTSVDKISDDILNGRLEELYDYIVELNHAQGRTIATAPMYKDLVHSILMHDYKTLSREELQIIYKHTIGDGVPDSPAKFSRFLAHHGIKMATVSRGSSVFRGIKVDWSADQTWYDETKARVTAERAPKLKVVKPSPEKEATNG